MMNKLKDVLDRVKAWPEADQAELVEYVEQIESRRNGDYQATTDELAAVDEAERSGLASAEKVEDAFRSFRRA